MKMIGRQRMKSKKVVESLKEVLGKVRIELSRLDPYAVHTVEEYKGVLINIDRVLEEYET